MSNKEEQQYLNILEELITAEHKDDRTGTGTNSLFCRHMRFDLSKSFPLLTTKKVFWKGVAVELLWFLSGSTNIKYLVDSRLKAVKMKPMYNVEHPIKWVDKFSSFNDQKANFFESTVSNYSKGTLSFDDF
jgi:thymidylate synthase